MWFQHDKEKERYYLLPGMGGRAHRRKQKVFLRWSIAAGLVVSVAFGLILYWMNLR